MVDDLALPLYPPMNLPQVQICQDALTQHLIEVLHQLKCVHFVSAKDYDEWCDFLLKAVEHNKTKLNLALVNSGIENVNLT